MWVNTDGNGVVGMGADNIVGSFINWFGFVGAFMLGLFPNFVSNLIVTGNSFDVCTKETFVDFGLADLL